MERVCRATRVCQLAYALKARGIKAGVSCSGGSVG